MTITDNVDCLLRPWSHAVVRLTVDDFRNTGFSRTTHHGPVPWGIEIASGKRCYIVRSGGDEVQGRRLNYYCGNSLKFAYVGNVDKSSLLWRIRRYKVIGDYSTRHRYKRDGWVNISRAWYGLPSDRGF